MCWFALLQLMRWTGKTQIRNKMSWPHMLYPMNDLGHRGTCVTTRHDDNACMQRQSNPEQQTSGGAHTSQKRQSHQFRPTTLHEPPAATPQPGRCTFTDHSQAFILSPTLTTACINGSCAPPSSRSMVASAHIVFATSCAFILSATVTTAGSFLHIPAPHQLLQMPTSSLPPPVPSFNLQHDVLLPAGAQVHLRKRSPALLETMQHSKPLALPA